MSSSSSKTRFESAHATDADFLVSFAVESNDIYKTRKVSVDTARDVFKIHKDVFDENTIEVLKSGEHIVGYYCFKTEPEGDEIELTHLFVKNGHQRKGYGTLLFNRCVDKARNRGGKIMTWIADPDSIEFYQKQGADCVSVEDNLLNPDVPVAIFNYGLV